MKKRALELNSKKIIILKKIKYSESDLILHGISAEGEKIGFMAKGALKSKKRFGGGVLEPTHYVELTYKETKTVGGLRWPQEAQLIRDFQDVRSSYDKIDFAWSMVECVYYISQEGDKHSPALFNLLGNALSTLETVENLELLKMHFYLKLLYQQGVVPSELWMTAFLKAAMSEGFSLKKLFELQQHKLPLIEKQVRNYLHSAEFSP